MLQVMTVMTSLSILCVHGIPLWLSASILDNTGQDPPVTDLFINHLQNARLIRQWPLPPDPEAVTCIDGLLRPL